MKKILVFSLALILIYVGVFFVPGRVERLSLMPDKITEAWRFLTYSFVHLDIMHLIENIAGLTLIALIAVELRIALGDFSSVYLSSGFLSVIPLWFMMSFTALGASNAIFGGFGLISQETRKFGVKVWIIILIATLLIFMKSFFAIGTGEFSSAIKQSLSHFFGFMFGICFFFLISKIRSISMNKKRSVLRGDYR